MPISWNEIKSRALIFSRIWADAANEESQGKPFQDKRPGLVYPSETLSTQSVQLPFEERILNCMSIRLLKPAQAWMKRRPPC